MLHSPGRGFLHHGLFIRLLMVVSEEVQDAVHQQDGKFLLCRMPRYFRLTARLWVRDDDLSERRIVVFGGREHEVDVGFAGAPVLFTVVLALRE